ncbi:hypothetical protein THAOC_32652 [Thalassiosira oceanica]|uniref:Uncharacterized protein n=1 Tax=Thalassiosira oceanica TaxID=159749 RepID=K0R6P5_THAOC|nr:hypothetical protein THAOC_32652 [Thalassiosira oceanica]|mmetsp:Transcript_6362/g.14674  ORF Transcript_6362/g.14674 Transcript_6362/m.14674 type:complete len:222 (+) Transcript_6362:261-926(+)|eukprot:EJK48540.1 hypothetical protein THAOC_32652 [Thalassiosira oceanica]
MYLEYQPPRETHDLRIVHGPHQHDDHGRQDDPPPHAGLVLLVVQKQRENPGQLEHEHSPDEREEARGAEAVRPLEEIHVLRDQALPQGRLAVYRHEGVDYRRVRPEGDAEADAESEGYPEAVVEPHRPGPLGSGLRRGSGERVARRGAEEPQCRVHQQGRDGGVAESLEPGLGERHVERRHLVEVAAPREEDELGYVRRGQAAGGLPHHRGGDGRCGPDCL